MARGLQSICQLRACSARFEPDNPNWGAFMIRNELEFKRTVARLTELHLELVDRRERLQLAGLTDEQIDEMIGDLIVRSQRLGEEIAVYERRTARTWVPA